MDTDPPVYGQPPPVRYGYPPPARSGRGWMWMTFLLAGLLITVGLVTLSHFAGVLTDGNFTGAQSGRSLEEITVEENRSGHKIAIIDVEGIITSQPWDRSGRNIVDLIEDQLELAERDRAVKAVVLKVDSPGGEVLASDDISRALLEFQEKSSKPVVAVFGGLAASGGYYIAAPCQWIVANELTITGSIGVIMHSFNYRGLLDKIGLYPQVFKSGKFKDMLSGSKRLEDIDPEEHKMIQAMIEETYLRFKSVVAKGRQRAKELNNGQGRNLVDNWEDLADGRVFTGKQAYESGFVDETGNFETAVNRAKKLAGVPNANLIRYEEPFRLSSLFNIFGKQESTTLKVDWGMDVPKLQAGRLYFLSSTILH